MVPKKVSESVSKKFGTEKNLGISLGKIWYRKKVSEPVLEIFCTGTNFRCQNLEILKIYNGYRYRIGTGTGNLLFFLVVLEPVSEKFGTEKSTGTGLEKKLVPKKVPEPILENFGTEKSIGTGLEKIWYRKKSRNRSRKNLVPEKSLGTGIGKIWYRKKSRNRSRKILVPKKSIRIGIVHILGLVTHWLEGDFSMCFGAFIC